MRTRTAPKPLTAIMLCLPLLHGCEQTSVKDKGDDGMATRTLQSRTFTTVLRPGESEAIEITSDVDLDIPLTMVVDSGDGLSVSTAQDCAVPDQRCERRTLTADAGLAVAKLDQLRYPNAQPVSLFPGATGSAPLVVAMAVGGDNDLEEYGFSVAITAHGQVWTWGYNAQGQLGDGTAQSRAVPQAVAGLTDIIAVSGGGAHVLALDRFGSVWAWGDGEVGQLGDGARRDRSTPIRVAALPPITAIAAGDDYSLALGEDGAVWGWGRNSRVPDEARLLGVAGEDVATPVMLTGVDDIVAIAAGSEQALAIDAERVLWAWGSDEHGATGSCDPRPDAVRVLEDVVDVATGKAFAVALTASGQVFAFGADNQFLQRGRRGSDRLCVPGPDGELEELVPVAGLDDAVQVAAGDWFALARRADGSVWFWGDNSFGQAGGFPSSPLLPGPVPSIAPVFNLAAGANHVLVTTVEDQCGSAPGENFNGRLTSWGSNLRGERGDGTAANWVAPTPVVTLGDGGACDGILGHRLVIYRGGVGGGTIASTAPGLRCVGMLCWQTVTTGTNVTLTATPDENSVVDGWRWDCPANAFTDTSALTILGPVLCKVVFDRTDREEVEDDAPPAGFDGTYNGTLVFAPDESTSNLLDLPEFITYSITVAVEDDTITLSAPGEFVDVSGRFDPQTGTFSDLSAIEDTSFRIRADGEVRDDGVTRSLAFTYVVADDAGGGGAIYRFEGTDP